MNSFLKTLLTNLAGVAAVTIDNAIGNPTGGLATYLGAHTDLALVYVAGVTFVHNLLSTYLPPAVTK